MVVWRPEGMLCNRPSLREDDKVGHCCPCRTGFMLSTTLVIIIIIISKGCPGRLQVHCKYDEHPVRAIFASMSMGIMVSKLTWYSRRDCQHGEDRWIWVIKSHRVHGAELAQVILVWGVVAMPRNHIEWGEGLCCREKLPLILLHDSVMAAAIFKPRYRRLEVTCICQSIAACHITTYADISMHS